MKFKIILSCLSGIALLTIIIIYDRYSHLKYQYQVLETEFSKQKSQAELYLTQVKQLQLVDERQTENLNNAKAQIRQLSDDLRSNNKRLLVKTVCTTTADNNSSSTGMDDARPAQLAPDAERNYLRLRRQLETLESQFLGLRERVREVYKQ
ncbi:lysis system i-spanin subunit Rz [Arsenophonus nasoniae]|uniref:Lysis system i-spanin subunit Rz n=1 Tax=Arsenophonus nasoniae TaxID=638 RepID=A0AA95GCT6_9GAMM|nr:lysis system i-spanin subunit Rz [Arsenophonus nasoniae]WGL93784.1 lysis system i-spanin subunit Rz [Arsenophonus nasoniae]WGL96004.1 lysis system i-spanin subunit Rz [Arsenophonus nasoniae]